MSAYQLPTPVYPSGIKVVLVSADGVPYRSWEVSKSQEEVIARLLDDLEDPQFDPATIVID